MKGEIKCDNIGNMIAWVIVKIFLFTKPNFSINFQNPWSIGIGVGYQRQPGSCPWLCISLLDELRSCALCLHWD